jgi:hypothetical protein
MTASAAMTIGMGSGFQPTDVIPAQAGIYASIHESYVGHVVDGRRHRDAMLRIDVPMT